MSTRKKVKIDEDLVDFMDVEIALKDYYDERKLKILVCGKTGTGKSSLLNTLLGRNLFEIGGPGDSHNFSFKPVTPKVTSVCTSIQNVFLEIFDSPGLQDGTDNDQEYLDDMHSKCRDVDLVLYCTDMTAVRWTPQEVKATKLLTEKFGAEFWKKTIIVLTKANMVKPHTAGEDEKKFCKTAYDNFERMLQKQLIEQGVPAEIANSIPVVTAGSDRDRYVPYVSKFVSETPEQEYQDFLPELWVTVFERMSGKSRFNFLKVTDYSKRIKINKDRLPRAQQEVLEELERQYKEKEEMLKENEKKLQERINKLNIERQEEINKIRRGIIDRYQHEPSQSVVQPPIVVPEDRFKKMVDGAISGATIGSFFGPIGTGIGAVFGAAASACNVM